MELGDWLELYSFDHLGSISQVDLEHPLPFGLPLGGDLDIRRDLRIALRALGDLQVLRIGRLPYIDEVYEL